MAKTSNAKSASTYIQRLLEDEYVQEQLRNAAVGLRQAYQRTQSKGGRAAEDKQLYDNLRHAATSVRRAATTLQRPKPNPKRTRPVGKLAIGALAIGGGAYLVTKRGQGPQQ
jgi:predicted RNA-binding Zn ribbon-like protein